MKKNLKLIVFAVVLCAVSALNVKVVLDTEHSGDLALTSLAAIGEGNSGEGGEGGGGMIMVRVVLILLVMYRCKIVVV